MSQFPEEQHLASWAGMSPRSNESASKKKYEDHPWGYIPESIIGSMWMGSNKNESNIS